MPKKEVTNEELYAKLEEIRQMNSTQLAMFKLVNAKAIEDSRAKILELAIRKKNFDLCDGKKTVTQITQTVFPGEPLVKAQPKVSYHLGDIGRLRSGRLQRRQRSTILLQKKGLM